MAFTFPEGMRQAIGRILRDEPAKGDGKLMLEALEMVVEHVSPKLSESCALQAEYGSRKLAHELIVIAEEEFERVTTESPAAVVEPGSQPGVGRGFRSRRRGPARFVRAG